MYDKIPQHVAIIMDGNGRWAQDRALVRSDGHEAGVRSVKTIIQACLKRGVSILSLFAFSSENWARPAEEVDCLMNLFLLSLKREAAQLFQNGISLRFLGCRQTLSENLQEEMRQVEQLTSGNTGLILNIMINYGGRWDIIQAAKKMAEKVAKGTLAVEEINEAVFSMHMSTAALPEPDLFIRTSGEQRISNFFLWQLTYTELYFTDIHWPDFNSEEFEKALQCFSQRKRRYGKVLSQLNEGGYV